LVGILGSDSGEARQRAVDEFQREDGPQLIVCSLRAGSQGITLTRASNVAFMDSTGPRPATTRPRTAYTESAS
jgi:SNF2 family DNA or RNA helicase